MLATLLASSVLAACGSQRDHADFVAAAGGAMGAGSRLGSAPTGEAVGEPGVAEIDTGAGVASGAPDAPGAPGAAGGGEQSQRQAAQAGGDHTPIVLGSVGNYSGPAGALMVPPTKVLQAWVADVNQRGGIGGRPVKLILVDDRSDPTRYRSAVQDLVENQGVVAFLGNFASLTAQGGADYLAEKRVPVISGENGNDTWWSNPMYFPFGAGDPGTAFGQLTAAAKVTDKRKLGMLTCQESQGCQGVTRSIRANAAKLGWEIVYDGEGSIAAPDFTAQCLAARNAGVDVFWLSFDTNSEKRIAEACARQGFQPVYMLGSADSSFEGMPVFANAVTVTFGFPFGYDGPETKSFRDAMGRYGQGIPFNLYTGQAWGTGVVFEKLAGAIRGPVTSEALLEQLWSLKGETAGGLLAPITFAKDQPAPQSRCIFLNVMKNGKFVPLNGLEPVCGGEG